MKINSNISSPEATPLLNFMISYRHYFQRCSLSNLIEGDINTQLLQGAEILCVTEQHIFFGHVVLL